MAVGLNFPLHRMTGDALNSRSLAHPVLVLILKSSTLMATTSSVDEKLL